MEGLGTQKTMIEIIKTDKINMVICMNKHQNNKIEINELRTIFLGIMKKFASICEDNNFEYWLFAGTLLGAVREKSFIEWDDDVDVMMPRASYDAFIDYCIENENEIYPYKIIHYKNTNTTTPIARLSDMRYRKVFKTEINECDQGVTISIFPLDGGGDSINDCKKIMKRGKLLQMALDSSRRSIFIKPHNKLLVIPKYIICKVLIMIGSRRIILILNRYALKHDGKTSKYLGKVMWGKMIYFSKEELGTIEGTFEGLTFRIPSGYDDILRRMYGDYVIPPPLHERVSTHYVDYYKREI